MNQDVAWCAAYVVAIGAPIHYYFVKSFSFLDDLILTIE